MIRSPFILSLLLLSACTGPLSPHVNQANPDLSTSGIVNGKIAVESDQLSSSVIGLQLVKETLIQDPFTGEVTQQVDDVKCSGVIIAEDMILTAAHCMAPSLAGKIVFAQNMNQENLPESLVREIDTFEFHEDYQNPMDPTSDLSKSLHDIAIAHFSGGLPEGFKPLKLASAKDVSFLKELTLAGYGITNTSNRDSGILRLRKQNFKVLKLKRQVIELDQREGGICSGDSGGPAFIRVGSEERIIGINSFVEPAGTGDPCGGKGTLTNASFYLDWIETTIEKLRLRVAGFEVTTKGEN